MPNVETRLTALISECKVADIVEYVIERYDLIVCVDDVERWVVEQECEIVNPMEWLRNRLLADGYFHSESAGCVTERITCTLHFFYLDEPGHIDWGLEDQREFALCEQMAEYRRPAFWRSMYRPVDGITLAARQLAGKYGESCLYCKRRFRNPHALTVHLEQSHPDAIRLRIFNN